MRNWAGNVTFSAATLHRPRTVEELQHLVATTPRIHALGTGHSFSTVADGPELVTVADLDTVIEVDSVTRTVDVGAGTTYGALAVELHRHGWALHNLGSLPHISVGGACATGTHGSGDTNPCLAAAVAAVEFVRADGELVEVSREEPAFGGSVLALGALGVVTRLTLEIQPTYEVRQDVWLAPPLDTVLEHFDEIMSSAYSVSMFLQRTVAVTQLWTKSRTDATAPDGRRWGATPADAPHNPVAGEDPSAATEQLGRPGPWHERLPHFRLEFRPSTGAEIQSEYLVAREHGPAAVEALRGLELSTALQVAEIRSIAADELWLSPANGRDSIGLHFTWTDDQQAVDAAVSAVETALAPYDPRPHWGKEFQAAPTHHHPQVDAFRELVDEHDPDRKFGNDFLQRYVY